MSKFENIETVSLEYKKGSQILSLSETLPDESNPSPDMGEAEKVSVNGAQGKMIPGFGENKMLIWTNGGLELILSSQLSKEEMIKVAGSIK